MAPIVIVCKQSTWRSLIWPILNGDPPYPKGIYKQIYWFHGPYIDENNYDPPLHIPETFE